ncbi:MAG: hypothetical protein M5R41_04140 [Bacteroidia bacterium]|nr:hypothetical protein [Bacteroidia bacterium]
MIIFPVTSLHALPRSFTNPILRFGILLSGIALVSVLCPPNMAGQKIEIGAYGVLGDMRFPVPNSTWGSWIRDTSESNSGRADAIPSRRWDQLRELGMTFAQFTVFPDAVRDDERNVALRLCKAAHARGLRLMLTDAGIRDLGEGERRVLHPESLHDFPERRAGVALHSVAAERHAYGCDRPLRHEGRENVLLLLPSRDVGARLLNRGCGGVRAQGSSGPASGHYVLSIRLAPMRMPAIHEERVVLTIHLRVGSDTVRFALGTTELAEAYLRNPAEAVEVALGGVHVYTKTDGRVSVRRTPESGSERNARTALAADADLVVEYHGVVPVSLDAVCLSDARSYAFCNPVDTHAEHHGFDEVVRKRLRLLGADSSAAWPALAWLEFAESLPEDAAWPIGRKMTAMLREAAGSKRAPVRLFTYTSGEASLDTQRIRGSAAIMLGKTSGFYSYPFQEAFHATPRDSWYYDSCYTPVPWEHGGRNTWTNLVQLPVWYRLYAEQRRAVGGIDWMPAIQNHSWQFRGGWPVLPIADTIWLREPSAAELRFNCNLALAYGASGLVFYSFSSWPGLATTPVVRKRSDPQYGNMGCIGFLDPHSNQPRRMDTNDESKWDSTRVSVLNELQPAGDALVGLLWQSGVSVEAGLRGRMIDVVRSVETKPFGGRDADVPGRRFVEVTAFSDPADSAATVLFILNKRVDAHGGRRIDIELSDRNVVQATELFPRGRFHAWDAAARRLVVDLPPASAVIVKLRRR